MHVVGSKRIGVRLASIAYGVAWVGMLLILIGAPVLKLLAGSEPEWEWGLPVSGVVLDMAAAVDTEWGAARLEVEDLRGTIRLPIALLPWSVFLVVWLHAVLAGALLLGFLYHLRHVLRHHASGAPFDPGNASRLRVMGWLLVGYGILEGVAGLVTAQAVRNGLSGGPLGVASGFHPDLVVAFVGLVLVALAEVFRRGAALEHEQSLVV